MKVFFFLVENVLISLCPFCLVLFLCLLSECFPVLVQFDIKRVLLITKDQVFSTETAYSFKKVYSSCSKRISRIDC